MSKTKIELEYPYNQDWKFGYIVINPEGRRTLILYNSHADRSSTQYARYLVAVKIGRYLTDQEEVDHKDDDFTNDHISNLQILTPELNYMKRLNKSYNLTPSYELPCEYCKNVFTFSQGEIDEKIRQNLNYIFCSRSCSAKFYIEKSSSCVGKSIPDNKITEIRALGKLGYSGYRISKITGISSTTVLKYLK